MSTTGATPHECDNCGAKLPPPDVAGNRTCIYCGTTYAPPASSSSPSPVPPTVNVTVGSGDFQPINANAAKSAAGCGGALAIFITLITLAAVAIPLWLVFSDGSFDFGSITGSFSSGSGLDPTEAYVPLPAEPSGPLPFVAIARHYDSGASDTVYEIVKVNGVDTTPVWKSEPISEWVYKHPLTADADRVYTTDGTKLLALKQTDGTVAWQGLLTDKVNTTELGKADCTACFAVVGGGFVTRTTDGVVQAFDPATGAPTWNRRLEDTNAPVMTAAGRVVIVDGPPTGAVVSVIDPVTGADLTSFSPGCQSQVFSSLDSLSSYDPAQVSPDGTQLTVWYGSPDVCVQRFDLATGGVVWQTYLPDDMSSVSSTGFWAVEGEGVLAFSGGREMGFIDVATGGITQVTLEDDLTAYPMAIAGGRVVITTESSRGTTSYGILAVDLASQGTAWSQNLGETAPADQPIGRGDETVTSGNSVFTAAVVGTSVRIVTFNGDSKALTVTNVDLASGAAAPSTTLQTGDGSLIPGFGPAVWVGPRVLLRAGDEKLVLVDTDQSTLAFSWP